jgi:HSP20 family molecular chaperone IbpA
LLASGTGAPARSLAPFHAGYRAYGCDPHVREEGKQAGCELQDSPDERHACDRNAGGNLIRMARRDIDRLQGEIEELFADLWQVPRFSGMRSGFRPAVDCFFTEEPPQLVVTVELAGVEPGSIDIAVDDRALTISGSRSRPRVPGQVYQQAEIEYGRFERRLALDHDIDGAAASADYQMGILTITLPIAPRRRRRDENVVIVVHRNT